jgi:hypothetical protein
LLKSKALQKRSANTSFQNCRSHTSEATTQGVYRRADPNKEDDKDELIYSYDFYVVKRIHDPEDGETLLLRLHLPRDGVREFVVPLNAVLSKEKFIGAIAAQGMAVLGKKQDTLMNYVARWVEHLQSTSKSEIARKQFGWLDDNSAFVVGDREILATGEIKYSPSHGGHITYSAYPSTQG